METQPRIASGVCDSWSQVSNTLVLSQISLSVRGRSTSAFYSLCTLHADHGCKWGQRKQKTPSVSRVSYVVLYTSSLAWILSVGRQDLNLCNYMFLCSMLVWQFSSSSGSVHYSKCMCAWFIATVGLDWYMTPIVHFIQQNPHHWTHKLKSNHKQCRMWPPKERVGRGPEETWL